MKKLALIAGLVAALLATALALAARGHGVALLVYTLVAVGMALALLVDFLGRALPRKAFAWSPRLRRRQVPKSIAQF